MANDPDSDIRQTLRNVRETTAMIAALRQDLQLLTKGTGERIYAISGKLEQVLDRTSGTLDKAGLAIETLNSTLLTVNRDLPGLTLRLDQSLKNVEAVTADARRISGALGEQLPGAIQDGRILVEDAREIVDGAKRAWPIRNLVTPATESTPSLDSYDAGKPKR